MKSKTTAAFVIALILGVIAFSHSSVSAAGVTTVNGHEVPVDIVVNGTYLNESAKGYLGTDGVTYVPVQSVSKALGAQVYYDETTGTLNVTKNADTLVFNLSASCCFVNGSMKFAGIRPEGDVLYAPIRFIVEALGGYVEWDNYYCEVDVTLPGHTVPKEMIETRYNADDILWLSKIVTCEAGSVSFEAKVMVSNVIINRRASDSFPNSIKEVIFDKKFGIQFPPAHNGRINKIPTPTTHTILACKAALNGLELAPGCLYFSYTSDNFSWVYRNRKLYTTIGNQAFYL